MKKIIIFIIFIAVVLSVQAQKFDCSFLDTENFKILGLDNTFVIPEGMRNKDDNGKPWALLKVKAVGFDENMLKDFIVYSPSSKLIIENVSFNPDDGFLKIMMSSGVEEKLVFKYKDTSKEYQLPESLIKSRVYELDLVLRKANLTIVVNPENATVMVDGVVSERKGLFNSTLSVGRHVYSVECDNYEPEIKKVVKLEKDELINVNLKPLFEYVNIKSKKIKSDTLCLSPSTSTDTLFITTNSSEWSFDSIPEWCNAIRGNNILIITTSENLGGDSRLGIIRILTEKSVKRLNVKQESERTMLNSDSNKIIFESEGNTITRTLEIGVESWNIKTSANWFKAYESSGKLVVVCSPNTEPVSRYGNIEVSVDDNTTNIEVVQKSKVTTLKVPSISVEFETGGGKMACPVETNFECWTCESDCEWINVSLSGGNVMVDCQRNTQADDRIGGVLIHAGTRNLRLSVTQKGTETKKPQILISSKPSWEKIFVDGVCIGRTPLYVSVDDFTHIVKCVNEERSYIFSEQIQNINFNQGMRYITATTSGTTFGIRSGFIGIKRFGAYSHFQMNVINTDVVPDSGKNPFYAISFGPSFEVTPWMSIYVGAGATMLTDTIKQTFDGEIEGGLMFYYRRFFISAGFQTTQLFSGNAKTTFSAGLGLYFGRYYDRKYGYCFDMSRRFWSLSVLYNHLENTFGLMFGDLGKTKVRGYAKVLCGVDKMDNLSVGLSGGAVFNLMGFNDILAGGGYIANLQNRSLGDELGGFIAELGVVMNVWRFPITVMFRYNNIGKSNDYLSVDFGFGFSFKE